MMLVHSEYTQDRGVYLLFLTLPKMDIPFRPERGAFRQRYPAQSKSVTTVGYRTITVSCLADCRTWSPEQKR